MGKIISAYNFFQATFQKDVDLSQPEGFSISRRGMCSFSNGGVMYIAGSDPERDDPSQIFQIKPDSIEIETQLPFLFSEGKI